MRGRGGIYWLASYPKSGNTWLRIFLANLLRGDNPPVEINAISLGTLASRRLLLEEALGVDTTWLSPQELEEMRPAIYDWLGMQKEILYCKIHDYYYTETHKPLIGQQGTLGVVYLVRNPLDVVVSAANHWGVSFELAVEFIHNERMVIGNLPHISTASQKLSSWSLHVTSWVDAANLSLLVVRYEDMLSSPVATFSRISHFLGLPFSESEIVQAIQFSDFKELVRQEQKHGFNGCPRQAKRFFNRGQSGQWRHALTPELVASVIQHHGQVMERFGYLDVQGLPI